MERTLLPSQRRSRSRHEHSHPKQPSHSLDDSHLAALDASGLHRHPSLPQQPITYSHVSSDVGIERHVLVNPESTPSGQSYTDLSLPFPNTSALSGHNDMGVSDNLRFPIRHPYRQSYLDGLQSSDEYTAQFMSYPLNLVTSEDGGRDWGGASTAPATMPRGYHNYY